MQIFTDPPRQTQVLGRLIARHAAAGDIVCLSGDLGSGKTVLTKGICAGLGVRAQTVTSPTFVLLNRYDGRIPVFHFDLYRINAPLDLAAIGYEEYLFDDGISVIEWADKLGCLLPREYLHVELRVQRENRRAITLRAKGNRYVRLLEKIDEDTCHRHLK
jgi:tRNA threonylcarbamoyladenosine biosynthesis protein TsaE